MLGCLINHNTDMTDFTKRVQKYVNVEDHQTPAQRGADIVEIKYDGWWARVMVNRGKALIYSRQGQLKAERDVQADDGTYVGEFLVGTQRAVQGADGGTGVVKIFDCLKLGRNEIHNLSLHDRKLMADRSIYECSFMEMAPHFPIAESEQLWYDHVDQGDAEGLVWKNSMDRYIGSTVWRKKQVFTMDYVILGVEEGAGKRQGMAGALLAGLFENGELVQKVRIGGGFNNEEMIDMWLNFDKYRGRVLEVKGWHLFDSGALRHPNAVRGADGQIRWRDDKAPEECIWPLLSEARAVRKRR